MGRTNRVLLKILTDWLKSLRRYGNNNNYFFSTIKVYSRTILIFRFYCLSSVYKKRKFAPFFFLVSFYLFPRVPRRTAIKLISPITYTVRHHFTLCFIENSRGIHVRTTLISKHDVYTFTVIRNCYLLNYHIHIAHTGRKYFWWFEFSYTRKIFIDWITMSTFKG